MLLLRGEERIPFKSGPTNARKDVPMRMAVMTLTIFDTSAMIRSDVNTNTSNNADATYQLLE
jgi:hypothetical protein